MHRNSRLSVDLHRCLLVLLVRLPCLSLLMPSFGPGFPAGASRTVLALDGVFNGLCQGNQAARNSQERQFAVCAA